MDRTIKLYDYDNRFNEIRNSVDRLSMEQVIGLFSSYALNRPADITISPFIDEDLFELRAVYNWNDTKAAPFVWGAIWRRKAEKPEWEFHS